MASSCTRGGLDEILDFFFPLEGLSKPLEHAAQRNGRIIIPGVN